MFHNVQMETSPLSQSHGRPVDGIDINLGATGQLKPLFILF